MTRILLTGASGMLGHDLVVQLGHHELTAPPSGDLDITDRAQVMAAVAGHDIVINAAAYTAVDQAESDEDRAFAINATGPRHLAEAASQHGAHLIQVSTDYVFSGDHDTPYDEGAPRAPRSVYGASKAAGEEAVLEVWPERSTIIRTAWLYGQHGSNFPRTMLEAQKTRQTLQVVTDQIGQPTWSHDLADWIALIVDSGCPPGILHGTNAGQTSWFDFARALFGLAGLNPERIQPTTSEAFVRPAARPAWSVLGHQRWAQLGLAEPRAWQEALEEAFPVMFPEFAR